MFIVPPTHRVVRGGKVVLTGQLPVCADEARANGGRVEPITEKPGDDQ